MKRVVVLWLACTASAVAAEPQLRFLHTFLDKGFVGITVSIDWGDAATATGSFQFEASSPFLWQSPTSGGALQVDTRPEALAAEQQDPLYDSSDGE